MKKPRPTAFFTRSSSAAVSAKAFTVACNKKKKSEISSDNRLEIKKMFISFLKQKIVNLIYFVWRTKFQKFIRIINFFLEIVASFI
jgi:hypothetical protein